MSNVFIWHNQWRIIVLDLITWKCAPWSNYVNQIMLTDYFFECNWVFTRTTDWTEYVRLRLSTKRYRADHSLRKLRSLNICSNMLHVFYRSLLESAICFKAICWGNSLKASDSKKLKKNDKEGWLCWGLIWSWLCKEECCTYLLNIMDHITDLLHHIVIKQQSMFC